ncbi:toxin-antitoxin system HicB family antitoxin [Nonomuraea sp. NPDC049152]|uniref:toxin-antitoxin system HicB family antitoxin n=1 Tax=Nonomuraea sp. NPDC049152 TaxID=3154350 RepID=UPI0033D299AA
MDLAPYVDYLRQELAAAAEVGGEEARALAERLTGPLESATRLALLEALSKAADEITRDLAPGSVDVRLRGRDPDFVVRAPFDESAEESFDSAPASAGVVRPPAPPLPQEGDEGGTSRINFRLPEHLKARVEEAAGKESLSVNAWLVRAVAATLNPDDSRRGDRRGSTTSGRRYTGWVR